MSLLSYSAQNKRLLGVDLFRGVSAYGVVLIHGLGELPRDEQALMISNFFVAFCVPFTGNGKIVSTNCQFSVVTVNFNHVVLSNLSCQLSDRPPFFSSSNYCKNFTCGLKQNDKQRSLPDQNACH